MKSILFFLVFLFGVMFGYGWQHYHNALYRAEVRENSRSVAAMEVKLAGMEDELAVRQKAVNIILCESAMRHNDMYGDGGRSFGWAQFQRRTFKTMAIEAGYNNFHYDNPYHQLLLLEWAIKNNYAEQHWRSCYRKVNGDYR